MRMRIHMRRVHGRVVCGLKKAGVLLLSICMLGGCAKQQPQADEKDGGENVQAGYVGMTGNRPQIQYRVSRMRPSVLTNQIGYETGSTKIVFFIGGENGQTYEVINAETGETVYSGKMEYAGRDEQLQRTVCYGMFTEAIISVRESLESRIRLPSGMCFTMICSGNSAAPMSGFGTMLCMIGTG